MKSRKHKKTDKIVPIELDGETYDYYKEVARLCGVDMDTALGVIVAAQAVAYKRNAKNKIKQTDRKLKRNPRKVR